MKGPIVQRAMANTGQTVHYLTGAQFHALTAADYKFKGELIRRLGLAVAISPSTRRIRRSRINWF